jgi:hypothetical protein
MIASWIQEELLYWEAAPEADAVMGSVHGGTVTRLPSLYTLDILQHIIFTSARR